MRSNARWVRAVKVHRGGGIGLLTIGPT